MISDGNKITEVVLFWVGMNDNIWFQNFMKKVYFVR